MKQKKSWYLFLDLIFEHYYKVYFSKKSKRVFYTQLSMQHNSRVKKKPICNIVTNFCHRFFSTIIWQIQHIDAFVVSLFIKFLTSRFEKNDMKV